jgi:hypothetical protein
MANDSRIFKPMILQTKEELLAALKAGQLTTSHYNLLDEQQKLFVELVCFGGYTAEEAMRSILPTARNAAALANRMLANKDVVTTMEEFTVAKTAKFNAEVSSARDMALEKLKYIMTTTDDDSLAASCAKVILDKAGDALKESKDKDEPVGTVAFNIQVENVYAPGVNPKQNEPVIIELTPEELNPAIGEAKQIKADLDKDIKKRKEELGKAEVNPETGLPYVLHYEGVNNYK